jgi:anti-anti-sigma factor
MEIKVMQASQVAVVAPDGNLDAESGAGMKRTLKDLLDTGHTKLIVDMGSVAYIDSAVWGELAMAAKRARDARGELRLCAMRGEMLAIFTMMRLSQVMAVYPTRESAMASWGIARESLLFRIRPT